MPYAQMKAELEKTYYGNGSPLQYPKLIEAVRRRPPKSPTGRVYPTNTDYWRAVNKLDQQMAENIKAAVVGSFQDEALPPVAAAAPAAEPPVERAVHVCPGHTRRVFDISTFPEVAEWAAKRVVAHKVDAIVGCGHSGLVIAGAISILTKVPVFAVRKQGDSPVAGTGPVSGIAPHGPAKRWCWVDDLIGSGGTLARSMKYLQDDEIIANIRPALVLLYMVGGADGPSGQEINGRVWEKSFPTERQPEMLFEYFTNRNK